MSLLVPIFSLREMGMESFGFLVFTWTLSKDVYYITIYNIYIYISLLIYFQVLGTCFCVQVSSYTVLPVFQCPDQYDRHAWFNRAIQVCPSDYQKYHCLMVVDEKTAPHYAEFCMTAQTIRKGSFRVLIYFFDLINLSYSCSLGTASSVDL